MCDMTAVSWICGGALVAWVAGLPVRAWSAWKLGSRDLPVGSGSRGHSLSPSGSLWHGDNTAKRLGCHAELPHMVRVGVNVRSLRSRTGTLD